MANIKANELNLFKIFSNEFDFNIPNYQRPYAWTDNEAIELIDDLYRFCCDMDEDENYFLGSIVLIKRNETESECDVIDGQQRLTTLSILFAVLAYKLQQLGETGLADEMKTCLYERGVVLAGIPESVRLHIRERDREYFRTYIQNVNIENLLQIQDISLQNDVQRNIRNNAKCMLEYLNEFNANVEDIKKFSSFLMTRCYLVEVHTSDQDSAFRIFTAMNNRGLNLLNSDLIKAKLMEGLQQEQSDRFSSKWEELESQTGRDEFNEVLSHIRQVFIKDKPRNSLLKDYEEIIMPNYRADALMENIITPYAEKYNLIRKGYQLSEAFDSEMKHFVEWLNKVDFSDWLPVALLFLAKYGDNQESLRWFLKKLERLVAFMFITQQNINKRIERFKPIIEEINAMDSDHFAGTMQSIELSQNEKQEFVDSLSGDVYQKAAKRRNYIVLRLDSFVSDGTAQYDRTRLTIEHVLPQTVAEGSQWQTWWQDIEERNTWVHRIANLVPLSRRKNSEAQNFDFDAKKERYFRGRNGVVAYALTTQVLIETEWTPAVLHRRQQKLMDIFKEKWELGD